MKEGSTVSICGPADERTATILGVARGFDRYKTAFLVDAAKPSVVSRILSLTGVHGHVAGALLAEMQDVQGSACFENCETTFRYSRCIRQGEVEASVLWGRDQTRAVESRGKWKNTEAGDLLSEERTTTSMCCEAWCGPTIGGYSVTTRKDWYAR